MNYESLYKRLINQYGLLTKPMNTYMERHHIIPKCVGGDNSSDNLIFLPPRIHYICHRILIKLYPNSNKLKFAFWAMCNQLTGDVQRKYKVSSHGYRIAKLAFCKANSELHKGKKIKPAQIELHRKRMKENNIHKKGKDSHFYGVPLPEETKLKVSTTKKAHPENNGQFKGYYITPVGKFASASQVNTITGVPNHAVINLCKNPKTKIKKCYLKWGYFDIKDVGKSAQELGWDFQYKPVSYV